MTMNQGEVRCHSHSLTHSNLLVDLIFIITIIFARVYDTHYSLWVIGKHAQLFILGIGTTSNRTPRRFCQRCCRCLKFSDLCLHIVVIAWIEKFDYFYVERRNPGRSSSNEMQPY